MNRTAIALLLIQSIVLLAAGLGTLWWSSDLMSLLIHLIGEERALGEENVVVLENGAKLLTNPMGMIRWTIPFWIIGTVQITSALSMIMLAGRDALRR